MTLLTLLRLNSPNPACEKTDVCDVRMSTQSSHIQHIINTTPYSKKLMESNPTETPPVENFLQFDGLGKGNDQPRDISSPLSILSTPIAKTMMKTVTSLLTTAIETQSHNTSPNLSRSWEFSGRMDGVEGSKLREVDLFCLYTVRQSNSSMSSVSSLASVSMSSCSSSVSLVSHCPFLRKIVNLVYTSSTQSESIYK